MIAADARPNISRMVELDQADLVLHEDDIHAQYFHMMDLLEVETNFVALFDGEAERLVLLQPKVIQIAELTPVVCDVALVISVIVVGALRHELELDCVGDACTRLRYDLEALNSRPEGVSVAILRGYIPVFEHLKSL